MEEQQTWYISSSNVWDVLGGFPRFPAPSDQPAPGHPCIDCGQPAPADEPTCWACEVEYWDATDVTWRCAGPADEQEGESI